MTRKEFGQQVMNIRQASGMKMMDICVELQVLPQAIYRVENGQFNSNIAFILQLLGVFGYSLKVGRYKLNKNSHTGKWLKKVRGKISQTEFGNTIGYRYQTIGMIETGQSTMSIDMFLKIADLFNYNISFVRNCE